MRIRTMLMLVVLLISVAACSPAPTPTTTTSTDTPAQKDIIAVVLPSLDNPLMLGFQDAFKGAFGTQYDVQVASADGNAVTQGTQVENFTAMKVKFMFVMAVEPTSLVPKLVAARQAGVKVLFAGGDPGDENAYDAVMKMDQFLAGAYAALMAKQWVDTTYPDAAPASIETAIFESTLNEEAVARSAGLRMIAEPYLKDATGAYIDATGAAISDAKGTYLAGKSDADRVPNPTYAPAVKIVQVQQAEMFQAVQTAMQNILTTNPQVRLVIAYAGDGAMGASKAMVDEYSKGPSLSVIADLKQVAVFGVGMIGGEGPAILDSTSDKGVFRGTVRFGGDLIGRTMEYAGKMLGGEPAPKIIWDVLDLVTVVDGKLVATAAESSGVIVVPTTEPQPLVLPGPPQ